MRDDVRTLVNELIKLYNEKLSKFKPFHAREINNNFLLLAGNIDALIESLSKDSDFMMHIDSLDFDITACYEKLSAITGIPHLEIDSFFKDLAKEPATEETRRDLKMLHTLLSAKKELHNITKQSFKERKKLISGLKENSEKIASSIDELSLIQVFEFEDFEE